MARLTSFLILILFAAACLGQAAPPEQHHHGQEEKPVVPWFTEQEIESPFPVDTNFLDISLTGFHRYDPFKRFDLFVAEKGNIGHAGFSMLFQPDLQSEFSLNPAHLYQGYILNHQNIRFFRPEHVYTNLQYVLGGNREQFFIADHNQRLGETFFVGGRYQVVNSPGFYSRQGASNSHVRLHFDFEQPNLRYQALGSVVFNRVNNQESGGLSNYLEFEQNLDRENVFLTSAASRYQENAFHLNHFYHTGFYLGGGADTLAERRFINLGRLNHRFSYRRFSFVFTENLSPFEGYYEGNPFFSNATYDSTRVHMLENQLSWSNFPLQGGRGRFPFNFQVFVRHRMVQVQQPDLAGIAADTLGNYIFVRDRFNQLVPGFELEGDQSRLISARASGSMTLGGYNDGDIDFGGSLRLGAAGRHRHSLIFRGHFAEKEAPYFLSHFQGNYVQWENDFSKTQWLHTGAIYSNPVFSLEANHYLVKNMVFMGPEALPVQNESTVNVLSAAIRAQLDLGILRSSHHIVYQRADDDYFLNFPQWAGKHSVYAEYNLFRRAMQAQTGFDVNYHMAYPPMGYMPVVRQFYAQDEFQGRHTWMLDFFANFRINRVRIFLKLENIGGMITDQPPVYLIPFYPIPQGAFKFGVSWMFFD